MNGVIPIFITMFHVGITLQLWLRRYHPGNILFSVVKAQTLMRVNREPLELTLTVLTTLTSLILSGPKLRPKMLTKHPLLVSIPR